jgi:hypothetical protein
MDELDLYLSEEEVQTEEVESLETSLLDDEAEFEATVTAELLSRWIGPGPSAIPQP